MKERFWLMDYNALVRLVYDARRIATDKGLRADVSVKGEADFVTAVDTGISAYIKEGLNKIAPGVAFVTEEESEHISVGERFVLDPIDGTTNLMRGYNVSSISLGYYADGEVRFGVVFDPFTNKMFFAVKGLGAHFYDTRFGMDRLTRIGVENYTADPLKVSSLPHTEAIVEFGAGSTNKAVAKESFEIAREVFENCMDLRRICSTALAITYIAAGWIDGYFERRIKVWDYCAASLILREAGGCISQWSGEELTFTDPSTIVAGNPDTYAYLLSVLKNR